MKNLISNGNRKIGNDTIIFNMNPASECPSEKLDLCKICKKCYAKKAERLYPQVLPFRMKQMYFWSTVTAENFADGIKDICLGNKMKIAKSKISNKAAKKIAKIKYLRFSESGDFATQADVDKLSKIADLLKGIVKVYTYTARIDLDFSNISSNLTVNGSGKMISNNFYIVKSESEKIDKYVCPGNCKACSLCKTAKSINIAVLEH